MRTTPECPKGMSLQFDEDTATFMCKPKMANLEPRYTAASFKPVPTT